MFKQIRKYVLFLVLGDRFEFRKKHLLRIYFFSLKQLSLV